jgi:hypothetical protein
MGVLVHDPDKLTDLSDKIIRENKIGRSIDLALTNPSPIEG